MRATMGISFRATAPVDLSTGDQKTNVLCVMDDIDADLALDSAPSCPARPCRPPPPALSSDSRRRRRAKPGAR